VNLRQQLQTIYDERGELTPQVVLDVARDDAHALHARFEWDDAVAGEKYRLVQAHELIRSVKVTFARPDGSQDSIRAFHAVRRDDSAQPGYEPLERLIDDPLARAIVVADMRREFATFKARYERFEEFFALLRDAVAA
jgi:hypothetical protein